MAGYFRIIRKAEPFGEEEIPDGIIRIEGKFPTMKTNATTTQRDAAFAGDARAIFDVLIGTLPGGTIDQLLILLLRHRASKLVVRRDSLEGGPS